MRPCLTTLVAVLLALTPLRTSSAQATARDSVLATVQRVFDAMRNRDTVGLREAFDSTARLVGGPTSPTAPARSRGTSQFLASIASTPADRASDERMFDPEVRIDGPVAQVWTYYTFRQGTTFSHCGNDALTLVRSGGTWRIVSFAWSIRTDCARKD
jgi:hypothetical protein